MTLRRVVLQPATGRPIEFEEDAAHKIYLVDQESTDCAVFFQISGGGIYTYDSLNQSTAFKFTAAGAIDVATTSNRLWVTSGSFIYEYAISLRPSFSYTYLRTIAADVSTGSGLAAKDNTTLIGSNGSQITNIDITNSPTTTTNVFSMQTGRGVVGDILYNPTLDRYIVSNSIGTTRYLTEYTSTGTVIKELTVTPADVFGIFADSGALYVVCGSGDVYKVLSGGISLVHNCGLAVFGASQTNTCTSISIP
jgi:hypothetical protein